MLRRYDLYRTHLVIAILFAAVLAGACSDKGDKGPAGDKTHEKPDNLVVTASGLQYFDIVEGTGKSPKIGDKVRIHLQSWYIPSGETDVYSDWTQDTSKADVLTANTYQNYEPLVFIIGYEEMIKGLEDGIMSMKTGGKRSMVIPDSLAYGSKEAGVIPPYSDLKFVVELMGVRTPVKIWDVDTSNAVSLGKGLKYIEVEAGNGPKPKKGQIVTVHLTGYLDEERIFEMTPEAGVPISFPLLVAPMVQGLDMGIANMRKGGKAKLIIPPNLAFGEEEFQMIPTNATLYYDVHLLDVQDKGANQ